VMFFYKIIVLRIPVDNTNFFSKLNAEVYIALG